MNSYAWPASITLLNILLLVWAGIRVARARARYGVAAPATSGDPNFERTFRVQMNTLENTVIFLPALWLDALYGHGWIVSAAGVVWIVARIVYALTYVRDPAKRGPGFGIAFAAFAVLAIDAAIGLVRSLLAAS